VGGFTSPKKPQAKRCKSLQISTLLRGAHEREPTLDFYGNGGGSSSSNIISGPRACGCHKPSAYFNDMFAPPSPPFLKS